MRALTPILILVVACSGKAADSSGDTRPDDYRYAAPYSATHSFHTVDGNPVLVWAPTRQGGGEYSLARITSSSAREQTITELVLAGNNGCPGDNYPGARDNDIVSGEWPLVAMSHCHACTASSLATIAMTLARWGHVVVAPSHEGDTLFDALDGTGMALDTDTLAMRVGQLDAAIEAARNGELGVEVTDELMLVGHSFGAVTVGMRAQLEPVPTVFLGAPADNPLLPGVDAAKLTAPTMWMLLEEDNSIGELGNSLIESNFAEVSGDSRLVRFPDAGHWSVSDIAGLTETTMPGCGEGTRQDGSGETFAYPDPWDATWHTSVVVTTALAGGLDQLDTLDGWETFTVESR